MYFAHLSSLQMSPNSVLIVVAIDVVSQFTILVTYTCTHLSNTFINIHVYHTQLSSINENLLPCSSAWSCFTPKFQAPKTSWNGQEELAVKVRRTVRNSTGVPGAELQAEQRVLRHSGFTRVWLVRCFRPDMGVSEDRGTLFGVPIKGILFRLGYN